MQNDDERAGEFDSLAVNLYTPDRGRHSCGQVLSFFDELMARRSGRPCPHCGGVVLQGLALDVTDERAGQMLDELRARRLQLHLPAGQ